MVSGGLDYKLILRPTKAIMRRACGFAADLETLKAVIGSRTDVSKTDDTTGEDLSVEAPFASRFLSFLADMCCVLYSRFGTRCKRRP